MRRPAIINGVARCDGFPCHRLALPLAADDTLCRKRGLRLFGGGQRLLTIVLARDAEGKRPDHMFYCTKLDWTPRRILSAYACRWAIEVTFENSKQLLGLEDPASRTEKAVRRTAPMALVLYSLIVAWLHQVGHRHVRFPDRPWYRRKRDPSFADMLTTLRRMSWLEHLRAVLPKSGVVKKRCRQKAVCAVRRVSLARRVTRAQSAHNQPIPPFNKPHARQPTAAARSKYARKKCET